MIYEEQIKEVELKLSDVQQATVNYLYHRMYEEGQGRMLVADEVGLGKTWIAKGLVAKRRPAETRRNANICQPAPAPAIAKNIATREPPANQMDTRPTVIHSATTKRITKASHTYCIILVTSYINTYSPNVFI